MTTSSTSGLVSVSDLLVEANGLLDGTRYLTASDGLPPDAVLDAAGYVARAAQEKVVAALEAINVILKQARAAK